jgi:hypothetical protein
MGIAGGRRRGRSLLDRKVNDLPATVGWEQLSAMQARDGWSAFPCRVLLVHGRPLAVAAAPVSGGHQRELRPVQPTVPRDPPETQLVEQQGKRRRDERHMLFRKALALIYPV